MHTHTATHTHGHTHTHSHTHTVTDTCCGTMGCVQVDMSVQNHMSELPELTHGVKFLPVAHATKESLTEAWKAWVEQAGELEVQYKLDKTCSSILDYIIPVVIRYLGLHNTYMIGAPMPMGLTQPCIGPARCVPA